MLIINMNSFLVLRKSDVSEQAYVDGSQWTRSPCRTTFELHFFFEQFFTVFVICTFLSIAFGFLYPSFLVLIWHFGCEDFDKDLGEVTLCVTLENDNFILKIP